MKSGVQEWGERDHTRRVSVHWAMVKGIVGGGGIVHNVQSTLVSCSLEKKKI